MRSPRTRLRASRTKQTSSLGSSSPFASASYMFTRRSQSIESMSLEVSGFDEEDAPVSDGLDRFLPDGSASASRSTWYCAPRARISMVEKFTLWVSC